MTRPFTIGEHRDGASHTLVLGGELDLAGAPELVGVAERLCTDGAARLTLDLSFLEFIDSAGLRAVLATRELCQENGCEFALTPGPEPVRRVFELTGLLHRLPFAQSELEPEAAERSRPLQGPPGDRPGRRLPGFMRPAQEPGGGGGEASPRPPDDSPGLPRERA